MGFSKKALNTILDHRAPISTKGGSVMMPVKRSAGRPRLHPSPTISSPMAVTPTPEAVTDTSQTGSDDNLTMSTPDDETSKCEDGQGDVPDFQPGSRLEVMDFNEKWYPVKVVEVDYEEGEVLVHFEKWSDRYDEWVRMDSNRIRRPVVLAQTSSSKKTFVKGEQVIAVWAYNHKYPATVKEVLASDKYEVLFCDGYAKVLRGCKLFKATEEDLKNVKMPPPKKPAPPMGADPLDPDLGPKEERRLKKQRLDVLQAYRPHKRRRLDPHSAPETSPQTRTPPPPPKLNETPKVVFRMRGRPPKKPREVPAEERDAEEEEENKWVYEDDDEQEVESEHEAVPETTPTGEKRGFRGRRRKRRRPFDESTYIYRGPKHRQGHEEDKERWNTEVPEGVAPVLIKDHEGYYRESIIIPDRKMPPGWTKHTMRRKSGAKWDVFLVNPDGRKFRSRNELRNYFAELKQPFPEEEFDFMVGRKMEMIKSQVEYRKKLHGVPISKLSPLYKLSPVHKTPDRDGQSDGKKSDADPRRVKTLLPKGKSSDGLDDSQTGSGRSPALTSPPFPISELRTPDGGFTCCGKTFRKENLFQMHMKHYHPEYSNLFGSTPNVADLAYARTVGEPLEDSRAEAMTPRNTLMERVNQYEAERKALSTPSPSPVLNGTKEPEKKVEKVVKPVESESPSVTKECDVKVEQSTATKVDGLEELPQVDGSKGKTEESAVPSDDRNKETHDKTDAAEHISSDDDLRLEYSGDTDEETEPPQRAEEAPPVTTPSPLPLATPAVPVIKPVSKVRPPEPKVSSPKTPITITKIVPPGQKPPSSTTKLTITLLSPMEREVKSTIKTMLPMRPPPAEPKETPDVSKPKEQKPKEEVEESTDKSKPRKRTVSECQPKKPKLVKPSTGSLEEPTAEGEGVSEERAPSPSASGTSYHRFSRNRSQVPRVSLEKLSITTDSNGRVVLTTPEDKITNSAGRRQFKNYKGANKISKRHKGSAAGSTVPVEEPAPPEPLEPAPPEPLEPAPPSDIVYENLRKEEIINCTCGYSEEDGLMIQCDLCLCWQHGLCNNIDKEADVPDKYVCYICLHPARERRSMRYLHHQDWLKEGKLPTLSFRPRDEELQKSRESMLKKSHDLASSVLQLQAVIRSLRVKNYIARKADHPKLYLWAKSWKEGSPDTNQLLEEEAASKEGASTSGPQPEAAIDETECRLRLLEHVEDYQQQVDDRLTSIQAQIAALESEDPDVASDEGDNYPVTKQTLQMLMRDLDTVGQAMAIRRPTT